MKAFILKLRGMPLLCLVLAALLMAGCNDGGIIPPDSEPYKLNKGKAWFLGETVGGADEYRIILTNAAFADDDIVTGNGETLSLLVYAEPAADDLKISSGTYFYSGTATVSAIVPSSKSYFVLSGSETRYPITGGSVVITLSGTTYTVTGTVECSGKEFEFEFRNHIDVREVEIPADPYIDVSIDKYLFTMEEATATLTIQSNIGWEIEVPAGAWWNVSRVEGNGDAEVTLTISVNEGDAKSAVITVSGRAADVDDFVEISQDEFDPVKIMDDDVFIELILDMFDADGNGKLSKQEVDAMWDEWVLDISFMDITSVKGIKYFPFGYIYAEGNKLTSFDVSGNTVLESLECFENLLTSVNVAGCTSLNYFDCKENRIEALDVSGCSALEYLYCNDNNIASLKTEGCTSLRYIDCFNNSISSLDVNSCVSLDNLHCHNNGMTSLTVSRCEYLINLNCYENSLSSLNVGGLQHLASVKCYDNNISQFNTSGCASLYGIDCRNNNITEFDVSDSGRAIRIIEAEGNPNLATIWVWSGFNLTDYPLFKPQTASLYKVK